MMTIRMQTALERATAAASSVVARPGISMSSTPLNAGATQCIIKYAQMPKVCYSNVICNAPKRRYVSWHGESREMRRAKPAIHESGNRLVSNRKRRFQAM
jgi:hypothetical protein